MNFVLGLLQKFNSNTKAAQDAARRRQQEAAAAQARQRQEQQQREKDRLRQEAGKMVRRNATVRSRGVAKRPQGGGRSSVGKRTSKEPKFMTAEQVALKMRGMSSDGGARGRARAGGGRPVPGQPPKPLPGMEFVVRKNRKKEIRVPHTSDYSDLFGDDYLKGIDIKCLNDMKEESAKATAEAQKILAERKKLAEELMKEAEESKRREEEAIKKGIKIDRNEWRKRAAEREYISVDKPLNMMSPAERARVMKEVRGGKRNEGSASGAAVSGAPLSSRGGAVRAGGGVAKGRVSKAEAKAASARAVEKRKAALKDRIMAATGGTSTQSRAASRASSESPSRRPVQVAQRRKPPEVYRESGGRSWTERERERERERGGRVEKSRGRDRYRGYNSDEFSEDDEDESDDEDLTGFEALEREEEESRKAALREDRMERKREMQHKKDKERRRREFERSRRG